MVDQRMAMLECGKSNHGETRDRETTAGGKRHGGALTEKMRVRLVVRTKQMGYRSADDFHACGDDVDNRLTKKLALDGELQAKTSGTTIFSLRRTAAWMNNEASLGSVPECGEKARAWDGGAICSETREARATIAAIYNTGRTCLGYVFVDSNSVGLDCSIKEEEPKNMI
jgi:hypothetical protein